MEFFQKHLHQIRKYTLAVVIALILVASAYHNILHALNNMIERSLIEIAKQGAKTVENDINWRFNNLNTISQIDAICNKENSMENKLKLLSSTNQRNESYELAIASVDGKLYSVLGKQYEVSKEEFFIKGLEGKPTVTLPQRIFSRGYTTMAFAVPIFNSNTNEINGVLCALYPTEALTRLVEDISFSNNGYGYILNEQGVTIAHKDRSLVKNKVNSILEAKNDSSLNQLATLEKRMISGETGSGFYMYKGGEKYMGFTKIEGVPWSFAATAPKSDVFNNANPIITFTIFFSIFFGLVVICINVYFTALNKKVKREEQSLKNAVETANIIIISFLEDGVIMDFNRIAEEKFGYTANQVIKILRIYDFLGLKDQKKLEKILEDSRNGVKENNFELSIHTKKGESEHAIFNLNILDQNETTQVYELMGIDISDRVKSEMELIDKHEELSAVYEELAASEEELRNQLDELISQKKMLQEKDERHNLVVEASNIGIWDWDATTKKSYYSDKWYDIHEVSKQEYKGKERDWINFILPADRKNSRFPFEEILENRASRYEGEYCIRTSEGKIKWIYAVGKGLYDKDNKLVRIAGAHSDITKMKESERKIKKLAYFDSLTGLPNRSQISEKLNTITAETKENIALIFIDLDSFKLINDSYGHTIGDKVLIEISKRLTPICADKMLLSRLGSDEFAILIWNYESEDTLAEFVENLIRHLEYTFVVNDYNISLSANIGIALYTQDAIGFDELLKNADTAAYKASEKKCNYLYYDNGMNDAIIERLNLRNSLKTAIDNNEFLLYYQPQFLSIDKKIMGFEALVRWKSETLGMVSPSKFIPAAEEFKLIIPLGEWVLEEAIKFIKRLNQQRKTDLIMSVNISVVQLIQSNFAETVLRLIETYEISPESLELEITESTMMESVDSALDNIMLLRSRGVRFALDDFGTGYSSLNYLTKIPINTLKIDKSFIDNIGQIKEKSLIIHSIIEIGHKLGLSIVAEGVETEAQLDYLVTRNCERIQGFIFSKPLPEEEILRLLDEEDSIGL